MPAKNNTPPEYATPCPDQPSDRPDNTRFVQGLLVTGEAAAANLGWLKPWKHIEKRPKKAQGPGRAARRGRACRPRRAGAAHASRIGDSRDASHVSPRAEASASVGPRSPPAQQAIGPRAKTTDPDEQRTARAHRSASRAGNPPFVVSRWRSTYGMKPGRVLRGGDLPPA